MEVNGAIYFHALKQNKLFYTCRKVFPYYLDEVRFPVPESIRVSAKFQLFWADVLMMLLLGYWHQKDVNFSEFKINFKFNSQLYREEVSHQEVCSIILLYCVAYEESLTPLHFSQQ